MENSKRDFIKFFLFGSLITWFGSIAYAAARFFTPAASLQNKLPKSVKLKKNKKDFSKNSSQIEPFGHLPAIVIRKKNGEFVSFFADCTHLGCTVQYNPSAEKIVCACHDGVFDLEGKNLDGPPPKPLIPLVVEVDSSGGIELKKSGASA